jgi:glutamyl-tRNA synthetase
MTAAPEGERKPPRVRIAPSPTGDPHVGTAYMALFNYAFARKHGGAFVLRIEDTDQQRSTRSSEDAIYDALRWLGLQWDEGPDVGGPFGPYRQSERTEIYRRHADVLIERGAAYRCFCSRERLDALRKEQISNKQNPGYDRRCRTLDAAESQRRADAGESFVVRLAIPEGGETVVRDELRGDVVFAHREIDEQVLVKSDGFPTYHLANVVDDHTMEITHVIRGEDWLTSTPKHLLLYRAFGWDPPRFYHLGLLRNEDKSKLSKRRNPVSIFHYRDLGYMPETFLNFLATLGFSTGDGRERFALQDMVNAFDWSRVKLGDPVFDARKLDAFSGDDIRALSADDLLVRIKAHCLADARLRTLLALCQERIGRLDDFIPYVSMFYGGTVEYDAVLPKLRLKQRGREETVSILATYLDEIEKDPSARAFTAAELEAFSRAFCERHAWKPKELFTLLRIGAVGRTAAPPLFETLEALGKDRVRLRLRDVAQRLAREPQW